VEAREQIVQSGKPGRVALVEICCYYHMRATTNPPDTLPPEYLDYEMWTGPAPMRPYNSLVHPRGWRAFMEYGNGIMGDMCIHMFDMVRWMLGLGWPKRISSTGGILVDKKSKANITDTQLATFDYDDLKIVWQHRTWGDTPDLKDPKYAWGATLYGDKGTLKASVMGYDCIPFGQGQPIHKDVTYELEQYPEDKTEKELEKRYDDKSGKSKQVIFSVKAGENVNVAQVRDLRGVLDREKAEIGVLISMEPATKPMLKEAAEELRASPQDAKCYRALYHTYVHPAPSQERAAELLDWPFSTFRRHLSAGVDRFTAMLWRQEIEGPAR